MRSEVLTVTKTSMVVSWVVTPCGILGTYKRFGETYCPEDGGSIFLRNVGIYIQVHTALQPRKTNIDIINAIQILHVISCK
jgi:hypothetical protein